MPTPKKKATPKAPGSTPKEHNGTAPDVEVEDLDEALDVIPFTYSITAYGADYPVDSIVKRMSTNDIIVPRFSWEPDPKSEIVGFQREYIWPRPKADRFIESLLLGLPVPGIFLVKELTGRLLVLDGHQRLYTLKAYYEGEINEEAYKLEGVQQQFVGKRYRDLDTEDRRRLDDSIIHATVIRQDEPTEDQSSIYLIFERLNSGGVNLQPQEIRVALYHGEFVRVLRKLNDNPAWRKLYGGKSKRLKDMEMILRFFAFYYNAKNYRSPMKNFLNFYMASNRDLSRQSETDLTNVFETTTAAIEAHIGDRAFRPVRAVNAAVIDSVMTGVARRLAAGPVRKPEQFLEHYDALLINQAFIEAVQTGTSQEANVHGRAEVERQKQKLDATFSRASKLVPLNDAEPLSDFARYLCVLVAGFIEQSVIELTLEHVRNHSQASVQGYAESRLRQFTSAKSQRIMDLMGTFDAGWRSDLESYLVDERKAAVDSVVALRHNIAHGLNVGVTMATMKDYYAHVKHVIDHIADLCVP
jgi:hypothetical protein